MRVTKESHLKQQSSLIRIKIEKTLTEIFLENNPEQRCSFLSFFNCSCTEVGMVDFPGCGKKRSDESMANLVDLNSEPGIDELSKQILSEAKLWEAIQEAKTELERRHQGRVRATEHSHSSEHQRKPKSLNIKSDFLSIFFFFLSKIWYPWIYPSDWECLI